MHVGSADAKYFAVGVCFGARLSMQMSAESYISGSKYRRCQDFTDTDPHDHPHSRVCTSFIYCRGSYESGHKSLVDVLRWLVFEAAYMRTNLTSSQETDNSFPAAARHRAEELLVEGVKTYCIEVFSGVSHGFATRGDLSDANIKWAREETFRAMVAWFTRFSAQ